MGEGCHGIGVREHGCPTAWTSGLIHSRCKLGAPNLRVAATALIVQDEITSILGSSHLSSTSCPFRQDRQREQWSPIMFTS
jgi:hypothetical protein